MALSVEKICNELNRKGLLLPANIRTLRQGWLRQAGAVASDPVQFVKWLVHQGQITDYQGDVLLRCVLHHTLAGQPPFEDRGPIRLVVSHASEPPPRLTNLNINMPSELQTVLDIMLAKDPALRYSTPGHAAQELRPFLMPK